MNNQLSQDQLEVLQSALQTGDLTILDIVQAFEAKVRSTERFMHNIIEPEDIELKELYDVRLAQEKAKLAIVEKIWVMGVEADAYACFKKATIKFGRTDGVKPVYKDPGLSNWKPTGC
jgi:hypothetical protein